MVRVHIAPSRIFGQCPAGHRMGDEFTIDGMAVQSVQGSVCYVALTAMGSQVNQIKRGERVLNHASCPGCSFGTDRENGVVFVLGSEEAWSLAKAYSAYNWARLDGRETEASASYREICWKLTQEGRYAEAEQAIEEAIGHLKPNESWRSGKTRAQTP